ncbi:MAG: LssY C-terminal domain-containing protein [Acidobacteriaceae bacterium]
MSIAILLKAIRRRAYTRRDGRALLLLLTCSCLALLPLAGSRLCAETIPAGTALEVRLQQPISSYSTRKGTKITGVLVAPVSQDGNILLPIGTAVDGTVVEVRKVGIGLVHETAEIDLRLDHLVLAGGETVPLQTRLTEVENARESINKKGRIEGIRSTSTLSHRASGIVGTLALGNPMAAIFTLTASTAVLRFSEPEISLPAGAEVSAQLTSPIEFSGGHAPVLPPIVSSPEGKTALGQMVRDLPFRTYTDQSNIPSDLTNLVFIADAGALERAFSASGWVPVDPLTAETTYRTVRSIAENQGYRSAPMSMLHLDGKPPEYAYAKTLNTFSKRHHLRIWKSNQLWKGETVWTSSSTHDIGIGFSKSNKTFIHLIDTHIDNERAKVVDDLIFTGCVSEVQLVARPWVPLDAKNGTDEALVTDGKVAVLRLSDCEDPTKESAGDSAKPLQIHGNVLDRTTRQTVLTLKNNLIRDNVGVMAYSGVRYLTTKKKEGPRPTREMELNGADYTIGQDADPRLAAELPPASKAKPKPRDRSTRAASWTPPSVELGLHGGWLGYFGGNGGAIGYLFQSVQPPEPFVLLVLGNGLDNGGNVGGSITLDSQKYLSHEFSFDYSLTTFDLGLAVIDNETTSESIQNQFAFASTGLRTSQFAYNLLINVRPRTSRLRPYFAVGPSLQLMHLSDAPIKKAPSWYRLGLSNIGLISAAYNFGSTPPLEGGGIFQVGLTYGGGIRYRVTPRWMVRTDFRETLTSQPDFWSKSRKDILDGLDYEDGSTLTEIGPVLDGLLRQDRVSAGVSFTF